MYRLRWEMNKGSMKKTSNQYIFISYASKNEEQANTLYKTLTSSRYGFACWMDRQKIEINEKTFQEQIVHGIRQAGCLILVDTRESQKSKYVKMELATAETYKVPIIRYKAKQAKWEFLNRLRLQWAIQRIQFRVTQPAWFTLLGLLLLLGAMIFSVLFLGTATARAAERYLPEAVFASISGNEDETQVDPSVAAPFYFVPDYAQILDDFNLDGEIDNDSYFYRGMAQEGTGVDIAKENERLHLFIPGSCSMVDGAFECQTEIVYGKHDIRWDYLQYFGFRARSVMNSSRLNVSLRISSESGENGFGWSFSDHATPFYKSSFAYPEEDFFAYVTMDNNWHAYEILLDPTMHKLFFYMDGQLIDTYMMQYYDEWVENNVMQFVLGVHGDGGDDADTYFEIDRLVVGGFR
jgi:hypothetical protein